VKHALHVCVTCRRPDWAADRPRDGLTLYQMVEAAYRLWHRRTEMALKPVECMSGCDRACTVGLSGEGKPGYLFCDTVPTEETAISALQLASQYLDSADGTLPRGERPLPFRGGILARIPTP
jgi:predicted metal-binding protein